jgi:thymidylate synthase ThyX
MTRHAVVHPIHAGPFGHPHLTVLVECPIFVAREWMRHRVQFFLR